MNKEAQKRAFKRWYERHKEEFAQRRKERYHNDPEYRARCLAYVKRYNAKKKIERKQKMTKPQEAAYTVAQAAKLIGISPYTLYRWGQIGYYPKVRGRKNFTNHQIGLLKRLHRELEKAGSPVARKKVAASMKQELYDGWWE